MTSVTDSDAEEDHLDMSQLIILLTNSKILCFLNGLFQHLSRITSAMGYSACVQESKMLRYHMIIRISRDRIWFDKIGKVGNDPVA